MQHCCDSYNIHTAHSTQHTAVSHPKKWNYARHARFDSYNQTDSYHNRTNNHLVNFCLKISDILDMHVYGLKILPSPSPSPPCKCSKVRKPVSLIHIFTKTLQIIRCKNYLLIFQNIHNADHEPRLVQVASLLTTVKSGREWRQN